MSDSAKSVRLFVGVPIAMQTVEELTGLARELRKGAEDGGLPVRWVSPATYHVTLKFLGWSRPEILDAVRDAIAGAVAAVPRFDFTTRGVGAFPKPERARVLWAGIDEPGGHLPALAAALDQAAAGLGFERETRPFHGHVTLGRLRQPSDVSRLLGPVAEKMFSKTSVDAVVLYKSVMKSTGSEYFVEAEFGLGGPGTGPEKR